MIIKPAAAPETFYGKMQIPREFIINIDSQAPAWIRCRVGMGGSEQELVFLVFFKTGFLLVALAVLELML